MAKPLLGPEILAGTRISDRLGSEPIIWLTTVSADGRPHSVPVWFHWTDPVITVFSQAGTAKVHRLRSNPAVSVCLDTAANGTDVVTGEGEATLVARSSVSAVLPAFEHKYRPMLGDRPLSAWLEEFSQPMVITLSKIIAWSRSADGLDYRSIRAPRAGD